MSSSGRSTAISLSTSRSCSKSAKSTTRSEINQDSVIANIDFSHEIKSGVSVVIPRPEYEKIRRTVVVERVHQKMPRDEVKQHERNIGHCPSTKKPKRAKSCPSGARRRRSEDDEKANVELRQKLEKFRQEQEVEIRTLKEMITEAKCLATRETQIVDKERRTREAKMTELELDKLLETQAKELDRKIEEFRSKRNTLNQSYADMIRQQIDVNEALRKNAERTMCDWELKLNERRMDRFREDLAQERTKKLEQQRELKQGLEEGVVERKKLVEQKKSEEAAILRKMEEYAAERAAWRSSLQEAEAKKVATRQLQSAAVLERLTDGNELNERMRAVKTRFIREELDRDWRQSEMKLEAARRDARRKLTEDREEQIACKRREAAEMAARQRQEHDRLLELERKEMEAWKETELRRKQRALEYGEYVRLQIKKKEELSRLEKRNHLLEATLVKKSHDDHDEKLLEIKAKKLQELKSNHEIPNRYVMEIARKSRVPWTILQ